MDTSESQQNLPENEFVKEIRQNLVDTAVQFLNMDKIISQPESIKRKFLEKKGLTTEEIEVAFEKTSKQGSQFYNQQMVRSHTEPPLSNYFPQNQLVPHHPGGFVGQRTFWTKLRDATNMLIFLSGMAFGIKYLYEHYIGPFLTGKKPRKEEDAILEIQKSVMTVLQQIEYTLERINSNILEHNKNQFDIENNKKIGSVSLEHLTTELSTIKSLLINKKSFPSSPAPYPSIPAWQKQAQTQVETSHDAKNRIEENTNEPQKITTAPEGTDEQKDCLKNGEVL